MRTSAKLISLVFTGLFIISGCASTEEVSMNAGEAAIGDAKAANAAAKAAGNEWRDTGKLIKYAEKALADGEEDKAVLLANKAKRQAMTAQDQAAIEDKKFMDGLSAKDKAALMNAENEITSNTAMPKQTLSTTRSSMGDGENSYTVVGGDSLWGIAGKSSVYSNAYQWPLIYKANRSKIKDADLIYPGQNFDIDRGASSAEIEAAVNHAKTRGAWSVGDVEQSDMEYLNK